MTKNFKFLSIFVCSKNIHPWENLEEIDLPIGETCHCDEEAKSVENIVGIPL